MSCSLIKGDEASAKDPLPSHLIGTVVSSLHRLKDTDNQDGGFFVFGDLSCKVEGKFRLLFTLYQMQKMECVHITSIVSDIFQVYPTKSFPGLAESTFLTRSFSDQGVRLRLRKDSRSMTTRKRNATAAEFVRKQQDPRDSGRRSMAGRTRSTDEGMPYGSTAAGGGFDPHAAASYGHYDTEGTMSKRRRLIVDDVGPPQPPTHSYASAVASTGPDLSAYGAPRTAYSAPSHLSMPVSSAPYGIAAQTTAAALGYGHPASHPHAHHHQLNRLDTQQHLGGGPHHAGPSSAGPGAFQSPSSRQSPHAFQYVALQASPSSMGYQPSSAASTSAHTLAASPAGDYRPHPGPLYTNATSADASPRTHPTPNPNTTPSGASTSPPDATADYTAAAAGSITPFTQSISPYSYAHALGDPQSHHLPPPPMATARSNGLPALDLQHVNGGGLGLDMNYAEVDRHNPGQTS